MPGRPERLLVPAPSLTQPLLPLGRPVLDVSAWDVAGPEAIGTKAKEWLRSPTGADWLFKASGSNTDNVGRTYLRGEDWAEVIASDLARAMGLPTAPVDLAVRNGVIGVVSGSVAGRGHGALVHGNEVLAGRFVGYAAGGARRNPDYTVGNVMDVLSAVEGPPDGFMPARVAFAGYLSMDALVGNTDRHHQNWALLRPKAGPIMLAPTFDHASSLGFLLSDDQRLARLGSPRDTVEAFADRASCPFTGTASPLDAAVDAYQRLTAKGRARVLDCVGSVTEPRIVEVLAQVPPARMSDPARSFAGRLMYYNRARLLEALRRVR